MQPRATRAAETMPIVPGCPTCADDTPHVAVRMEPAARERFIALSEMKYGGIMNDWLDDMAITILRCPACGHHWYREQPDVNRLAAMYAAATPLMVGGEHSPGWKAHDAYIRQQLAKLARLARLLKMRQPRFLEYGAGAGRWADAATAIGFKVCAYEPHSIRMRGPRRAYEVVTRAEDIGARRFDIINVEQVLEHVPDPYALVRSLHRYCVSGTVLRFTVPDLTRAAGPSLWKDWPFNGRTMHLMAPFEHLHGFTAASLAALMARAGFIPARGPAVWSAFPKYSVRRGLSRLFPLLGQTMALVRAAGSAN